jgi:lipopolysaccharide export system protein LptA
MTTRIPTTFAIVAALSAAGALAAFPASAQIATNSKSPVDVTADQLETANANCQATWRGKAEALQDTARLRADVLRIFNKKGPPKPSAAGGKTGGDSCGDMDRMEAEGSVYYVTSKGEKVRANKAVYEAGSTTITMIGDVIAVQGQNVLRGDRMVFNTETGEGHMEGGTGKNRPRGVFYPNQSSATSDKPK